MTDSHGRPLVLNYGPRMEKFAMRPPELDAKINLLIGSVRSGKTWGVHPKILYLSKYPVAGRRLITGVSKAAIKTNVLQDLFNIVGPKNCAYNAMSGELRIFGAEWLVYGAKDEGSEKYLRGATIGAAVCDELTLMPQSYFQMLLTRLSPPGARLYATTNADNSEHWLKKQYIDNEELIADHLLWHETYTMDDNPNLDKDYVNSQKKLYTGAFYDRMILGMWNQVGGACYAGCWGEHNMYDDITRPVGLYGQGGFSDHIVTIDYGTTNPCVFLDWIDDGHTTWCDNEYYWDSKKEQRQKTDAEYVADLEKFVAASNCKVAPKVIVDPSAASFIAALQASGKFWLIECDNTVVDGIRRVASALKQGKIKFHRTKCPNCLREHVNYAWDDNKAKRGEEAPLKRGDHTCDGTRYMGNNVYVNEWRLAA